MPLRLPADRYVPLCHQDRTMRILLILTPLCICSPSYSQVDTSGIIFFKHIAHLVKEDRIKELSQLISYPLERDNPLPNIESSDAFILYYPTLFDSTLKTLILTSDSSNIWQRYWYHTIDQGQIWLDENGKIIRINYSSAAEQNLLHVLDLEAKKNIHKSVNSWKNNILLCKTPSYVLRVDDTEKGLRYCSWTLPKSTSDEPDLILYDGDFGAHGTQGGIYYRFTNAEWTYVVDLWNICDIPENCGLFLVVLEKDKQILKQRCQTFK